MTMFQHDEDRVDRSAGELQARLVMMMGGRAADKLVVGEPLSGAGVTDEGVPYLVMALLTGDTVAARLERARADMTLHFVSDVDEVLALALVPDAKGAVA